MIGELTLIHRIKQHLGKVQDIAFSANSQFLASLGGQDDNALIIWDAQSGEAICGAPAAQDSSLCCRWLHGRNDRLVTGESVLSVLFFILIIDLDSDLDSKLLCSALLQSKFSICVLLVAYASLSYLMISILPSSSYSVSSL